MDKTFAETQGKAPFDWNKWLDAAIDRHPSLSEKLEADERARSWVTCACGNQCAIIPRAAETINSSEMYRYQGAPIDNRLYMLGCDFLRDIASDNFVRAKQTLFEIELRSAEIIAEELAKLNALTPAN